MSRMSLLKKPSTAERGVRGEKNTKTAKASPFLTESLKDSAFSACSAVNGLF